MPQPDLILFAALARNERFQAWIEGERQKYTGSLIRMVDETGVRHLQGRLQLLDDISKLCDAATKT